MVIMQLLCYNYDAEQDNIGSGKGESQCIGGIVVCVVGSSVR